MTINYRPDQGSFAGSLGTALGTAGGQGLNSYLNEMFQKRENKGFASNLASQLGLKNDMAENFVNTFGKLSPQQQIPALQKLEEARATANYYSNQGTMQSNQEQVSDNSRNRQPMKIGGVDFTAEDLVPLRSEKSIPPIGNLLEPSKEQRERFKENRKEILDYEKPYENITDLKINLDKLRQAEKLIDRIDPNTLRKGLLAIGEGHPVTELLKSEDEQKLFSLLRPALKPKDIGGSNPSTREVLIALEAIPSLLKSKGANKYIIKNLIDQAEADYRKGLVIQNLRKINPNADPSKFKELVERKISNPIKNIGNSKVKVRINGQIGEIPGDKLEEALGMGAELL